MRRTPVILASAGVSALLLIAMITGAGAHGVQHALFAHNADKVDGKHAVGAGATTGQAAGKLVATNGSGKIPAKFLPGDSTATAYAFVTADGDFSKTKNVVDVDESGPLEAYYCIDLAAGVTVQNVQVTISNGQSGEADVMINDPYIACDGSADGDVIVETRDSTGAPAERYFYVLVN
jgi:hypothetical protein